MIGYLEGKIISKKPTQLLLNVNGVGYLVNISINTFENLPDVNETSSIYIHMSVREGAIDLYGFLTLSEKEMFEMLISVNGIGPKLALGILSGINVEALKEAIRNDNISRIVSVPGIGRKTAQRLLVELKDKINKLDHEEIGSSSADYSVKSDAIAALTNLGYNLKTAEKVVSQILIAKPDISIEDLIKEALNNLIK